MFVRHLWQQRWKWYICDRLRFLNPLRCCRAHWRSLYIQA